MAFVVIVLPLMACGYSERSYQGDTMANLPPERFALGLQLLPRSSTEKLGQDRRLPFNPIVRLRLTSSSGSA